MRPSTLTCSAILISVVAACASDRPTKSDASGSSAPSTEPSTDTSASSNRQAIAPRPRRFRDDALAGPAYVATHSQVLMIDTDGTTDVVFEYPGIADLEAEPTGDVLVRSSGGLTRISGRSVKNVTTSVPGAATSFAAAADDDVWAIEPNAAHHFDGTSWVATPVATTSLRPLREVAIDKRGVAWLAAGEDGLFEWDGRRWKKSAGVAGNVMQVASAHEGVFVLRKEGFAQLASEDIKAVFSPLGAEISGGEITLGGAWILVSSPTSGPRMLIAGKDGEKSWEDNVTRLGEGSVWFTADAAGRAWGAGKRAVTIATKDAANVVIPLSSAVDGELFAVEVVGKGPEKLPSEIGLSVSMPLPESSAPPSSASAQGNVTINAPSGFADGAVSNASSVIAGMAAGFRRCYNRALQENPNVKGSLRVTAKIGQNGEVLSAKASGGTGLSQTMTSCITARVSSATFAKPTAGTATIEIPLTFNQAAP